MNRKEIIEKLKENKKLVFVISIIFISGIIIGISISTIDLSKQKRYYIATDDTFTLGIDENDYFGQLPYLKSEHSDDVGYNIFMKFDLTEKTSSNANISFYIYKNYDHCPWGYLRMWLSVPTQPHAKTWNDNMNSEEVWSIIQNNTLTRILGQPAVNTFNTSIGFVNFEITDFIYVVEGTFAFYRKYK